MDTMNTIFSRKSVRNYTGAKISEEAMKTILTAAQAAPAAKARYENLHLTVIEDPKLLQVIDEAARKMIGNPSLRPLYGAPMLVLVSARPIESECGNVEFSNAAIMVHNMAIAATELSVGACHIWGAIRALNQSPELVAKLELPEGFVPCCAITLGTTTESYTLREVPGDRVGINYLK